MLVRECYTDLVRDANGDLILDRQGQPIGLPGERWVEMPNVLTEAEGIAADRLAAIDAANEAIRQQLNDLDLRYGTRALSEAFDGDRTRLDWLNAEKAKLRAQFVGVSEIQTPSAPTM